MLHDTILPNKPHNYSALVLLGLFLESVALSPVVFNVLFGGSAVDPTRQQSALGFLAFLVSDP